jgi:hypothetical protein
MLEEDESRMLAEQLQNESYGGSNPNPPPRQNNQDDFGGFGGGFGGGADVR